MLSQASMLYLLMLIFPKSSTTFAGQIAFQATFIFKSTFFHDLEVYVY